MRQADFTQFRTEYNFERPTGIRVFDIAGQSVKVAIGGGVCAGKEGASICVHPVSSLNNWHWLINHCQLMDEKLQLRIHSKANLPTLIYLPGLHGDWTLAGGFLKALNGRARFVEITYPRTLVWSLDDYAAAIESALAQNKIQSGWLLGESFGSQPLWALVGRNKFQAQGVILAGGFVKHPMRWTVRLAERLTGRMSNRLFVWVIFSYAKIARFRYRHTPAVLTRIDEFVTRRTILDRQAAQHRLHLIANFDPRPIARQTKLPVFGLTGILDPIVPWPFVRRWLKRNCPALRDYKIIKRADHNVLGTGAKRSVEQILEWIGGASRAD